MPPTTEFDAIVLAGGSGRRLGGVDKASVQVGDQTLLDRVLQALTAARRVVVVGPARRLPSAVLGTSEEPPGGGPVAGLAAGLALVEAPLVAVLACDLPFLTASTLAALLDAVRSAAPARAASSAPARPDGTEQRADGTGQQADGPEQRANGPERRADGREHGTDGAVVGMRAGGREPDGAQLVDETGRRQPLTAVYRTAFLRQAVAELDHVAGTSMRQVTSRLTMLDVQAGDSPAWDCDTWADVERARRRVDEQLVEES